eukprot:3126538-Pleurochrysis_carterae.AAC.1
MYRLCCALALTLHTEAVVRSTAYRAFDAHQAVLGRGSDHRVRQVLSVAPALTVRFDPANVLAPAQWAHQSAQVGRGE